MASWKGHIAFSFIFVAIVFIIDYKWLHFLGFPSLLELAWFIPIIIFMSNSPDLDHQSSNVREFTTIALLIAVSALIWLKQQPLYGITLLGILIILWILPRFNGWGHRGHYHSIIFIALLSSPLYFFFGWKVALVGFLAAFSHLLADAHIKMW